MNGLLLALMLLGEPAGEPPAATAKPVFIVQPAWRNWPAPEVMAAFYPATAGGATGRAVVECLVNVAGDLMNCRVLEESAPGLGFGEAAVALVSARFSIGSKDRAGRGVAGRPIRVVITWDARIASLAAAATTRKQVGPDGTVLAEAGEADGCPMIDWRHAEGCTTRGGRDSPTLPRASLDSFAYEWADEPSSGDYGRTRPKALLRSSVPGDAFLFCVLKLDGRLTACRVTAESPEGRGFGEAALKLSRRYRMKLPLDGRSLEGETVSIRLSWNPAPRSGRGSMSPYISRPPVQPTK
ncbi:MAG: hypothetical protein Q8J89_13400 [Caulobacter sp.]|nr:hypothetical protein [Caulobacter sp.]